ncbi:hypothetical protein EMPS_03657 [Entomortierella parvispora]|uniref:Uncharacterized protein n=1 Tax=Entomortierella parvispora TaxID=205924 RepID=A0A9P3H764_9FUNG|nr:hypothetical protein EMPS_03657 [Entomortierella parvispora]
MPRLRTKIKHLLILLFLGYGYSVWLLHKSAKKPARHVSSKFSVQPREADPTLKKFIKKLPLKERFEIERRHIGYNLKLDQKDAFDFSSCGMWPAQYLKNKQNQAPKSNNQAGQQIAADYSTRRMIVHSCGGAGREDEDGILIQEEPCGQISDRLLSTVSLFVYGLLTDREFFIDWHGHPLRSLLRTPFMNLSPPPDPPSPKDAKKASNGQSWDPVSVSLQDWEAEELDATFRIQSTSVYLDTRKSVLRGESYGPQSQQQPSQHVVRTRDQIMTAPQLRVQLNRGLAQRFLTDPSYADQLESIGLRQHNAYECVLSFLFRPTQSIQEMIHQYRAVFKTPGVVTVGIHLPSRIEHVHSLQRSQKSRLDLADFEQSIPCAQELSQAISKKNQSPGIRFLYVILTDTEHIRQQVQDQYGQHLDLIFPPLSYQLHQLSLQGNNEDENDKFKRRDVTYQHGDGQEYHENENEESTLLQSYLFSETDYQIVTATGFSKLALFRKGVAGRRTAVLMPSNDEAELFKEGSKNGIRLPKCSRLEDAIAPWDLIASFGSLG